MTLPFGVGKVQELLNQRMQRKKRRYQKGIKKSEDESYKIIRFK